MGWAGTLAWHLPLRGGVGGACTALRRRPPRRTTGLAVGEGTCLVKINCRSLLEVLSHCSFLSDQRIPMEKSLEVKCEESYNQFAGRRAHRPAAQGRGGGASGLFGTRSPEQHRLEPAFGMAQAWMTNVCKWRKFVTGCAVSGTGRG